jgi:hypothetical protein
MFDDCNEHFWENRGEGVRGRFFLVQMPVNVYREQDVVTEIRKLCNKRSRADRTRFATAYELVAYAMAGWNGRDSTVALGSKFEHDGAPIIYRAERHRMLGIDRPNASRMWRDHHVLCVRI